MFTRVLLSVAAGLACAAAAVPALAIPRTFVQSTGADTNPCTRILPCRSFAVAALATDAGGEIGVLDSAGYGPVTLTQSVSISAPDGIYAGITVPAGQHGIVANGPQIKVALRGLAINGAAGALNAVHVVSAASVVVERCRITFVAKGIEVLSPSARVVVTDTTIRGTGGGGIVLAATLVELIVDRSRIEGNKGGGGIQGVGVRGGNIAITDSTIARNVPAGIRIANSAIIVSPWNVTVARSVVEGHEDFAPGFPDSGFGIDVGAGTLGEYHVAVVDSLIRGNGNGIRIAPNAGETARVVVGNSRINANAGNGFFCLGTGTTAATVDTNVVTGNGTGIANGGATCTITSLDNNLVEENGTNVSGAVTTVLRK